MNFPGSVNVVYSKRLSGTIIVGIEGALKAASRDSGLRFTNSNPTYGEEMPNEIRSWISKEVASRYAPIANEVMALRERGENWRDLRDQSREILNQIANEAQEKWRHG